jgi:hypothetical protein
MQFMTSIKLQHVSALGYHPQGVFQNKAIQVQPVKLGNAYRNQWNDLNFKNSKICRID